MTPFCKYRQQAASLKRAGYRYCMQPVAVNSNTWLAVYIKMLNIKIDQPLCSSR